MKLDDVLAMVRGSDPETDWYPVPLGPESSPKNGVYRPNVSLTIRAGIELASNRNINWVSEAFGDSSVGYDTNEIYFGGSLVDRFRTIPVDGGSAILPLPSSLDVPPRSVTALQCHVARIVHHLIGGSGDFDDFLTRSEIQIIQP